MVKCTGRGPVVKRPAVLSKVQMLNLVLGVGVFSLLPKISCRKKVRRIFEFSSQMLQLSWHLSRDRRQDLGATLSETGFAILWLSLLDVRAYDHGPEAQNILR